MEYVEITNFNLYKEKWNIESETIVKPGLESIQKALKQLGNPQDKHRIIHVAGTNGKGSTIAFLQAIAKEHGLAYGAFMSPSIVDVHDQIQLNSQNVTTDQMDRAFEKIQKAGISGTLTDFELLTVVAFLVFEQEDLDFVFIETGMGGRYDSTNVLTQSIAVIPSISIDHTNFLGSTIEEISWHKAGILKENGKLVMGKLLDEARNIFLHEAQEKNALTMEYEKDFCVQNGIYTYGQTQFKHLYPSMLGYHQLSNMALAITALLESGCPLVERKVQAAVQVANLPSRMEKVGDNIYFDGAHNRASIDALVDMIHLHFSGKKIHFIVGMLKDKDYIYMLRKLEEVGSSFEFVDFHHERALPASELYKHCLHNEKVINEYKKNVKIDNIQKSGITIVTGSLYFVSELREKTGK